MVSKVWNRKRLKIAIRVLWFINALMALMVVRLLIG